MTIHTAPPFTYQACKKCGRINPGDAAFCYHDGSALGSPDGGGAPIKTGAKLFPSPFAFPSGRICQNFDQLVLGFQENWDEAAELLRKGYLESFLAGMGRADLAAVARSAAQLPDRDRGLDHLLAKLPTDVWLAPTLHVEPHQINLGQLRIGEDRQIPVRLLNEGMGLLTGTVDVDGCDWVTLGDSTGGSEKVFQFTRELEIRLFVSGKRLRAGAKPLAGQLVVDSNGGCVTCAMRAEVPVQPFPDGVLAGATSPKAAAKIARASPREATPSFSSGAVARWFEANGWTYPVSGPVAEGPASVQQFFDGLGLSEPSRIELNPGEVSFSGAPGQEMTRVLELTNVEKRPIYAHATCDCDWLRIGAVQLRGRNATIPLSIPRIPEGEQETLHATVTIVANGKHQIQVPVTLEITSSFRFDHEAPPAPTPRPPSAPRPRAKLPDIMRWVAALRSDSFRKVLADRRVAIPTVLLILCAAGFSLWKATRKGVSVANSGGAVVLAEPSLHLELKFNSKMRFGLSLLGVPDPLKPDQSKRLTGREDGTTNNTCIQVDDFSFLFGAAPGRWAKDTQGRSLKSVKLELGVPGKSSTWDVPQGNLVVRQTVMLVRDTENRDTCFVHYRIDNRDNREHRVGLRFLLDTSTGSTGGVPFLVPRQAGQLDGIWDSKLHDIPPVLEAREKPDPKNPGVIAYLSLKPVGTVLDGDPQVAQPDRVVICRCPENPDIKWSWDFLPLSKTVANACVVIYWAEKAMPAGSARAMAFTYGLGSSGREKGANK